MLQVPLEKDHLVSPFFDDDSREKVDSILSKYRLMKMLDWKNKSNSLVFWQEVHDFGDSTGNFPLRVISNGVWKMLCVPMFNQEVGRVLERAGALRARLAYLEPRVLEDTIVCKLALQGLAKDTTHFQPPAELVRD